MGGAQLDADDRARRGRRPPASASATATAERLQNGVQTSTKVGADVVVDEWVGARVAVGEYVAGDAEDGVPARVRLPAEVDEQQVPVQRQPADAEHDDDGQEHPRRVRRPPPPATRRGRRLGRTDHWLATTGAQKSQDEEVHRDDDWQRNDVGEREERQEQSRPVHLFDTTQPTTSIGCLKIAWGLISFKNF